MGCGWVGRGRGWRGGLNRTRLDGIARSAHTRTGAVIPRIGCASHVEADWRLRFGVSCARDSISRCLAGVA
eukprot:934067-Prymnesium_polylepis.1